MGQIVEADTIERSIESVSREKSTKTFEKNNIKRG